MLPLEAGHPGLLAGVGAEKEGGEGAAQTHVSSFSRSGLCPLVDGKG